MSTNKVIDYFLYKCKSMFIKLNFLPKKFAVDFDSEFYLKMYPDLVNINPYKHFIIHGISEGRIGAPPKLQYSGDFATLDPALDTVLVVSHEASRTGAPILSLNIIHELKKKYNVVTVLLGKGDLVDEFKRHSHVLVDLFSHADNLKLQYILIDQLLQLVNVKFAIVNSVESRLILQPLALNYVPSVTLIHEFASSTRPRNAFNEVFFWSGETVFSAQVVRESAVDVCPDLAARKPIIIPQGRCLLPTQFIGATPVANETDLITRSFSQDSCSEGPVIILGAGTVNFRKGVDLFIDCAAQVNNLIDDIPCHFIWVGKGYDPDNDLGYSVYLQDQVCRSGISGMFTFLDEVSDLDTLYKRADILLLSSRLDPLPNVAIDAMYHGLPVVCFDKTTGIADILHQLDLSDECVAAYLDTGDLAGKVLGLIKAADKRLRIGSLLKRASLDLFDMTAYVDKLERVAIGVAKASKQEKDDGLLVGGSNKLCPDYYLSPQLSTQSEDHASQRFVRSWASGISMRKPFPGFHPGVYQDHQKSSTAEADPFADYLRAGEPAGPWLWDVITPTISRKKASSPERVAMHLHIFYPDLAKEIIDRLNKNSVNPDLLISFASQSVLSQVQPVLDAYLGKVADIQIVPNRGRDIGPLLTSFGKGLVDNYDVIGHMHTKKTADWSDLSVGRSWFLFLLDNLLGGHHCMADIILNKMSEDPSVGLVFPDDPNALGWAKNYQYALPLAKRMGIHDLSKGHFNFPVGTMFWARTEAIRKLIELDFVWEDYPSEPLPYDGSMLHAIERLLPFVTENAGYRTMVTNVPGVTR